MNSGWRDLHFHGNLSVTRNFKKRLNPIWVANTCWCTGPIQITTVNEIIRKIETLVLNTPQNPYLNQATPKKCLPKINLPKTIPKSKISIPKKSPGFPCVQESPKNFISTPPKDHRFSKKGGSDFLFNEANKIWTLDEYVACQES